MNLADWTSQVESARFSVALLALAVMGVWERVRPFRALRASRSQRWLSNLSLVAFNSLLLRLVFPLGAAGIASFAALNGYGLFNLVDLNPAFEITVSVVMMDFIIWCQHALFHRIDFFWKFHKVHHADLDLDVTSGGRFHPVEIFLSFLIKMTAIFVIGPSVLAVVLFEIILNACSSFNHSNISLPRPIEKGLRLVMVTPDFHRIHHSTIRGESNSNYGFNLTIWDRWFGTWTKESARGQHGMVLGLEEFQKEPRVTGFWWALGLPFRKTGDLNFR
jgi:sterol desaturase/sphingolipid hydroxylase (fatty acid hydroxylase superfamily)